MNEDGSMDWRRESVPVSGILSLSLSLLSLSSTTTTGAFPAVNTDLDLTHSLSLSTVKKMADFKIASLTDSPPSPCVRRPHRQKDFQLQ